MKSTKKKNQNNNLSENCSQEKLNSTISSDTLRILSLLKSYPSTAASSSFNIENKQNSSTFNNQSLENNSKIDNLSYEQIKAICLKIFMVYAIPVNGEFFLSQRNIFRILKEMEILNENCLSYQDIEIIIRQINRKAEKLNSEEFLDLLAKICCLLDESFYKDKRGSFIKLIKLYIEPYFQKMENNDKNDKSNNNSIDKSYMEYEKIHLNLNFKDLILNEYKLDKDSFDILFSIKEGLKIIYNSYFSLSEKSFNTDNTRLYKQSFNIFNKFLKEFDIVPNLLPKRLAELYWSIIVQADINELYKKDFNNQNDNDNDNGNEIESFLNNKKYNIGKIYSFKKYFLLLPHVSFYFFYSIKSKTQGQKLLYIIERIYKSKGYQNMPNFYNKTFNNRFSIIPPIPIVEKVTKNIIINNNCLSYDKVCHEIDYKKFLKDFIKLNDENYNILEKYIEQLKISFIFYCHIYDKYQYGKMSFSHFQKMLSDGEILIINDNIETGKEKNLNSSNKKLDKTTSQENNIYSNTNLNNNEINSNNNNTSNTNNNTNLFVNSKKTDMNFETKKSVNNNKLKLKDLNIIVSQLCGNLNLTKYENLLNTNLNLTSFSSFNKNLDSSNCFSNKIPNIRTNICYKIDFILFLKSLPLIALKMYPNEKNDINISLKQFLEKDIENFLSNLNTKSVTHTQNSEYNNLFKLISSQDSIIQLMNDISDFIKYYFELYTEIDLNKEKLCKFSSFLKFFKDYEIYPYWVSFSTLLEIFQTQIFRQNKEKKNILEICEKINFHQFLECFMVVGLTLNSGNDLDMIDKILFMIDKMFSDNYGKVVKKLKTIPRFKEDFFYFEKVLKEKYPSYYERKYSNCNHRYDNKFYWIYEKNYVDEKSSVTNQIDFGELFNKEKVKFNDVFEELNNSKKENKNQSYGGDENFNEIKEEQI